MTGLRMLACDAVLSVAAHGPVCIVLWRGAVTKPTFEVQRAALESVVKAHDVAALLCIIEAGAKPPDEALRRASVEMVRSHRERLRCVACVFEGVGFKAASNRAILSGMAMFYEKAPGQQVGVFATVDESAVWLGKHMKLLSPSALPVDVARMRSWMTAFASESDRAS